ncbi:MULTISPECIES: uracil-DNA glycosylase [Aerococcus]|uniref:Uracil-DNA glycosylase n=1 Tax=Aerococcus viridans TaxID=1377 RepID=A0A2N6UG21_9LACT|nr:MULTISPECIES: uracil-DNA glycosylase [Aerococcus]OFU51703.1 uracil-DNA glycosylase [Aerococcus sp. HMSC10H05]PMC80507.1 uracil-DNA glycosylase [Aerococcus viridans]
MTSFGKLPSDWARELAPVLTSETFRTFEKFIAAEYKKGPVYPDPMNIYAAFEHTPFNQVKVVILGQDPYHQPGQAQGLSFSVAKGVKIPPSLRNIYKELEADLAISQVDHGDLREWADQGVLLLNAVLTVPDSQANAHKSKGWELLTDAAIEALNDAPKPIVFILWGNSAKAKARLIDTNKHYILSSVHPSPLSASRGFFGTKPFSKANALLVQSGRTPINWQLSE